jgi:hypothetical protein
MSGDVKHTILLCLFPRRQHVESVPEQTGVRFSLPHANAGRNTWVTLK